MRLHSTKNDLAETVRSQAIELLNSRLADCIDLQTQTKQAHWNARGANFIALHKLFDEINESVEGFSDTIAERAVQLGGTARGTARQVAVKSSLAEYPLKISSGRDHVIALSACWPLSANLPAKPSVMRVSFGITLPPTSSPRSLAASTSGSGWWKLHLKRPRPSAFERRSTTV